MSYILDALKRADAERSRGAVPGLHDRQLPSSDNAAAPLLHSRVWLSIVAAGLLGAVAVGLWAWRAPTVVVPALPVPLAAAPMTLPAPLAPTASAQPVAAPETNSAKNAGTSAATGTGKTTGTAVALNDSPGDISNAAKVAKPGPTTPATTSPRASASALKIAPTQPSAPPVTATSATTPTPAVTPVTPPVATPVALPAPAPAALPLLSELPDTLRSQLPKLALTGTVYAEDPAQRLLLVNNQVLPQGSAVAPDLTLEEIKPRHSVFNFRGTRFRVTH